MKLSDYVIDFLIQCGVKHVFGIVGGGAMHLFDSLGRRRDKIELVCNMHEQAAAYAAGAYAAITGLGVCMVTTGPGGLNAVSGCAASYYDGYPVLHISGQVQVADLLQNNGGVRCYGSQETDIISVVKPITKYAVTVTDPKKIVEVLSLAVTIAKSGRAGSVWVDIPLDVQAADIKAIEFNEKDGYQ
jgi:acetolactate synthase-1/2/3 large subunit